MTRYFTGEPCINGHVSERLVSNRSCIEYSRIRKLQWASDNQAMLNERTQLRRLEEPETFKIYDRLRYQYNPKLKMFTAAKQRAKLKGLWFTITIEDILIPKICPLLNIPIIVGEGSIIDNSPTLDRIKNKLDYVKGNVIVISHLANRCKQNLNSDDLFLLAQNLKSLEETHMPEWLALEKGFI